MDGEEEGLLHLQGLLGILGIIQKIVTMIQGHHLPGTMTEETTGYMKSMSGTTMTESRPGTIPSPVAGIIHLPAGTMTDAMIQGTDTMTRGKDTTRIGTETGMDLRPGLTTTDPLFQGGTTMTPEIMKGMRDIQAATIAALEGVEALYHPQGGETTDGVTRMMEGRPKPRKPINVVSRHVDRMHPKNG